MVRPPHVEEIADAVKVTGVRPVDDAVNELAPTELPTVQLPTAAMPAELVTAEAPVIDPPPDATAKVTDMPDFALPFASRTTTEGGIGTVFPTGTA